MTRIPRLLVVEWVEGNEVRLFFSSGKVVELRLPWVRSARKVRIVDGGMGLDPGDGKDVSASSLAEQPGRVLRKGRRGFLGSPARRRSKDVVPVPSSNHSSRS